MFQLLWGTHLKDFSPPATYAGRYKKMKTQKCSIIIDRISEFKNRLRSYSIYLDGEKIHKIKNGERFEFSTQAGSHQIGVKLGWVKSDLFKINIAEGETKYVILSTPPSNWKSTFALIMCGVLTGLGGMLFGAIGAGIGGGIGATIYGPIACKPQLSENKLL